MVVSPGCSPCWRNRGGTAASRSECQRPLQLASRADSGPLLPNGQELTDYPTGSGLSPTLAIHNCLPLRPNLPCSGQDADFADSDANAPVTVSYDRTACRRG